MNGNDDMILAVIFGVIVIFPVAWTLLCWVGRKVKDATEGKPK